jgi:cytochrome c biogenesis factor
VDVTSGLAASVLAFTGLPAVQLMLVGLVVLLLGVLLLAVRRRLASDE